MSEIVLSSNRGMQLVREVQQRAAQVLASGLTVTADNLALNTEFLDRTENKNNDAMAPLVIINHDTATTTDALALNRRHLSRVIGSSWNYIISRNGTVYWYVNENKYDAWHAGISRIDRYGWKSTRVRQFSIGIEHVNKNDGTPLTPEQFTSSVKLYRYLGQKHRITLQPGLTVFQHRDVAVFANGKPGRKTDARSASIESIVAAANARPEEQSLRETGFYRVVVSPATSKARVRQGPATTYPTAVLLPNGTVTFIDVWKKDERNEVIFGDTLWGHMQTQEGFIAGALLQKTTVLGKDGTNVLGENIHRSPVLRAQIEHSIARFEAVSVYNLRQLGLDTAQIVTCGGYADEVEPSEPGDLWERRIS